MDEPCHGYYIHGKTPWGKADIPLHVMQKKLQDEANSEYGENSRGLTEKNDRIQSYEIYLHKQLREDLYNARRETPTLKALERAATTQTKRVVKVEEEVHDEDEDDDMIERSISSSWSEKEKTIRRMEYKKNKISEILKKHIGQKISRSNIKESDYWTRWAGATPDNLDVATMDSPVIIQDLGEGSPSFVNMLYRDLDWAMLDLYIMLFMAFDELLVDNSMLAIFIVWIIERIIKEIRQRMSASNMSEKTFVDSRFLK